MNKSFVMGMVCVLGLAVVAQDIYVQGLADPENGGKVTGSAFAKPAKNVTLTVAPTKGWVFTAWQDGNKIAKRVVPYAEAVANANAEDVAEYTATFLPIAELEKPVVTAVDGVVTGMVGVAFNLPVEYESLCVATVAATKLPGGLTLKNGIISGVPKKAGVTVITLTASNPAGKSDAVQVVIEILPLPLSAQGTFTGAFLEGVIAPTGEPDELSTNILVVGTLTMTVSASGKMSAKTITDKGKVTLTAPSWAIQNGNVLTAELKTKKGEAMTLMLNTSYYFATFPIGVSLAGGAFEGVNWEIWAQKKSFSKQGGAATEALIQTCFGSYNAVFVNREMTATGNAANMPQGFGYCTLTLNVDGAVKIAGKLADGKAISGSTTLLLCDSWDLFEWILGIRYVNIPIYMPMYSGLGKFSSILVINGGYPGAISFFTDAPARWIYPGKSPAAKVPQTEDAFEAQLDCLGSVYFSNQDLRERYTQEMFIADAPDLPYTYTKGGYTETVGAWTNLLPNVQLNASKMTLPKGKAVAVKNGDYVIDDANPSATTFSLAKKSGVFKGNFNVYYEYTDEKGVANLKSVPVKYEGVLLPYASSPFPSGAGFYLMPDTWVDTADPKKPVTYKMNRSFGILVAPAED